MARVITGRFLCGGFPFFQCDFDMDRVRRSTRKRVEREYDGESSEGESSLVGTPVPTAAITTAGVRDFGGCLKSVFLGHRATVEVLFLVQKHSAGWWLTKKMREVECELEPHEYRVIEKIQASLQTSHQSEQHQQVRDGFSRPKAFPNHACAGRGWDNRNLYLQHQIRPVEIKRPFFPVFALLCVPNALPLYIVHFTIKVILWILTQRLSATPMATRPLPIFLALLNF